MDQTLVSDVNPLDRAFSRTTLSIAGIFLLVYTLWLTLVVGLRTDHIYFILFLVVTYFASSLTRRFVLGFIFFWLFWIVYDAMRVYPNYLINSIHIIEPYHLEKYLFPIAIGNEILTPNEYFYQNANAVSDFLSGIFYLTWVPLPMAYGIYLFKTDKKMLLQFTAAFLFANLVGFTIYYLYPAAPPWYVFYHGTDLNFEIPGNAAQLLRFDELINYPLFANMYNKNANVFAAIPSLHAAYPVVLLYYGIKKRHKWLAVLFAIDVIGIWYAAVYSMHHYIIDVILGFFCAIIAIFVFDFVLMKTKMRTFIDKYAKFIA
ncbi:MAG: phosphatase PAP2 family protein [Bacteroidota bacterium]